jgi:hypothetical protein|tara:strand:+ start:3852 stop:5330 length:1479 start_codon:yes stop_codon:yes gene_type:complete
MKPFSLFYSLSLSRKKFFRAPQWEFKLAIRILLGFVVLYFFLAFLFLGIGGYYLLKKQNPETDPIFLINSFLGIYFAVDLLIRYFFQAIPVTEVKPLLLLPITKRVIIHGVLVRSLGSIFNAVPLVILFPFCIVHSVENGMIYSVWIWFLSIICLSLSNNYLTFLINKSNKIAAVFLGVFAIGYIVDYFFNFSISHYFGQGLEFIYTKPYWAVIPVIVLFTAILLADNFLRKQLFLDKGLSKKKERIIGSNLDFFDRWERMGVFLKNDLRLIIRNIRARQVVLMGVLFLFYGLFFFTQDQYSEMPSMLIFAGLFITGGFMITFGQYVPAWDSEYYSFLMCQNLSYRRYLKSKLYLMMFSVVVSSISSLPYLYFGSKVMLIIWASGIFNFGFGSMITLYSGAFNTNPVKLNIKAKAFENTQNFSFIQLLFILPKLILPLLVFYIPYVFFGFYAGLLGLVFIGLSGVIFQKQLLNVIVKTYQKKKYQTIASFND